VASSRLRLLPTLLLPALAACDDTPVQVILIDSRTGVTPGGGGGSGGGGGAPSGDAGEVPSLQRCTIAGGGLALGRGVPALAAGGGRLYVVSDGALVGLELLPGDGCALVPAPGFRAPPLPSVTLPQLAATADGRVVLRDGQVVRAYDRDGVEERVCELDPTSTLVGFSDFDGDYVQGISARGEVERVELNTLCVPTDDELTPPPSAGAYLGQSAVDFHLVVEPSLAGAPNVVRYGGEEFARLASYEGGELTGELCPGLPAVVLCHGADVCVLDPTCSAVRRFSFEGEERGRLDLDARGLQVLAVAAETGEPWGWAIATDGAGEVVIVRVGR